MAAAAIMGCGSANGSWAKVNDVSAINGNARRNCKQKKNKGLRVSCVYSAAVSNPYKVLRITPTASESDVKKAFRKLALQYHPDVCKGNNGGMTFTKIYEAYEVAMSNLRGEESRAAAAMYAEPVVEKEEEYESGYDEDNLWEEWMGWEGAGIRDYSSHINPYI